MAPSVLVPSISLARRQNGFIGFSPGACEHNTKKQCSVSNPPAHRHAHERKTDKRACGTTGKSSIVA